MLSGMYIKTCTHWPHSWRVAVTYWSYWRRSLWTGCSKTRNWTKTSLLYLQQNPQIVAFDHIWEMIWSWARETVPELLRSSSSSVVLMFGVWDHSA